MDIKGVIVAAGYGSRFLPATKTIPKEMLPLIDRPAIQFIIDEFLDAGIKDILIITSRRKKVLDDYFDREVELESVFERDGKLDKMARVLPSEGNFYFVRQQVMNGTGNALLLAKPFTGNSPFVVAYPDDIVFGPKSLSTQLVEAHQQTGKSILAVKDLHNEDVSRYGVVHPNGDGNPCDVRCLVEKPARGTEPSKLVSYGRYLFTAEIYDHLLNLRDPEHKGEYYHIPALNALAAAGKVAALDYEGDRLDTGEPLGYLEAICRYALNREDLKEKAKTLFQDLGQ